ncbi:MAG: DUF721 domain-containing protein [Actinomycetota bacterium]|nr:DUF721 domain-containing protein [Actinomycetota bacterium]
MSELEPLSFSLGEVLRGLGMDEPELFIELVEGWEQVAGELWAVHGRPMSLRQGELVVEVADGAAAGVLRYAISALLRSIEERFGAGRVASVRIQVGRPARP